MAIVNVRINGRDYALACDDGEEEHLRLLADEVDERVRSLTFRMRANPGEAMGLLLTALTMADELIENKKQIEKLAAGALSGAGADDSRLQEIETAMAITLEEIAVRIEKIAEQIEIH